MSCCRLRTRMDRQQWAQVSDPLDKESTSGSREVSGTRPRHTLQGHNCTNSHGSAPAGIWWCMDPARQPHPVCLLLVPAGQSISLHGESGVARAWNGGQGHPLIREIRLHGWPDACRI